jgi:hypothetical protein
MNISRHPAKLSMSTLMAFIIAVGTMPGQVLAQVEIDDMRELGYEVTNLGAVEVNGEQCRRLQLDNIPGVEMPFPQMIMLVRETDNYPLQVDYYDEQGRNIKTLKTVAIERTNGVPASMRMTMMNHLDGTETNFDLNINYEE